MNLTLKAITRLPSGKTFSHNVFFQYNSKEIFMMMISKARKKINNKIDGSLQGHANGPPFLGRFVNKIKTYNIISYRCSCVFVLQLGINRYTSS